MMNKPTEPAKTAEGDLLAETTQNTVLSEFITEEQCARELGKSVGTLRRWRRETDIPFTAAGRDILYHPPTLKAWLLGRMRQRNTNANRRKAAS